AVSVTAIVAVAILLVCAHHQTSIWRDNETLWRHTLDCTENNIIAHINLGNALSDQKEYAKATDEYRAALAIDPSSSEALNNLGRLLFAQGRDGPTSARQASWEEGLRYFGQAVQMRPEQAERHYRFADALASTGRLDAAVAEYGEAIRIDPDLADAENGLGKTLSDLGRPEQAIAHYRAALRIAPEHAEAHYNLAIALSQCRRFTEAIAESREAIRLKPDDAEAHNNLGLALAGAGRLSEAMTEYREAARINPDCIQALGNLAAAYVGVGRRSDAIETLRTALKRATEQRDREMISVLRARLSQYEAASPSR
ncbi:MAG: tetratricopeptide repeat protein, partial [Thermoguttaceae bacterium]